MGQHFRKTNRWTVTEHDGTRVGVVRGVTIDDAKAAVAIEYPNVDACWYSEIYEPVPFPSDDERSISPEMVETAYALYEQGERVFDKLMDMLAAMGWNAAKRVSLKRLCEEYHENYR